MNKTIIAAIALCVGFGSGVLATMKYFEKKYKDISDEEIESVREAYEEYKKKLEADKSNDISKEKPKQKEKKIVKSSEPFDKASFAQTEMIIEKHNYASSSVDSDDIGQITLHDISNEDARDEPYVISPDEFGTMDDYDNITLVYYSDNVLADEDDTIIENIEDTVGLSALTSFGEYEDDCVFVRNDRLKTDYEILLDSRTWVETAGG